eukprot:12917199-Prorocentrum_lima.AAC.1
MDMVAILFLHKILCRHVLLHPPFPRKGQFWVSYLLTDCPSEHHELRLCHVEEFSSTLEIGQ